MDGMLLLEGYKLKQAVYLNLQKHTIFITHSDYYTPVVMFDLLERYFGKKDFSEKYLQSNIQISLNNDKLMPTDYIVYRIKPVIDLEAETKIVKKSVLGQFLEQKYRDQEDVFQSVSETMETEILAKINNTLTAYGMKMCCQEQNIFNFAKMLTLNCYVENEEILFEEHSQYQAKKFFLDLISKLVTEKPKLLLFELPEYGLDDSEIKALFHSLINVDNIENVLIYTNSKEILEYVRDIYAYHIIKAGSILGFDDYDEMELLISDKFYNGKSKEQLLDELLKAVFNETEYNEKFGDIDKLFRK